MPNAIPLCPECGGELLVCVGQAIQSSEVVWWRSCRCPGCGYAIEEDGVEQISDIRKSILRTEGQWKLFVEVSSHRTRGFAEARQLLELELADVAGLRQIDPDCIATGTKVEMECLRQRLKAKGIVARVIPAPRRTSE